MANSDVSEALRTLDRELRGIFGTRLQAVVAYGSRSGTRASPARTMALVESLTEQDLRGCSARVAAWHEQGLATPLLQPAGELSRSLDAFPLEFSAIIADHVVVAGSDPFGGAAIDHADIRRACEVQARSHLLHLRQGFLEAAGNAHALAVLVVESAPPLTALLTNLARLEGRPNLDPSAASRHAERTLGVPGGSISDVVNLRQVQEIPSAEAERIFPPYLAAMQRLVEYVDGWAAQ